MPPHLSSACATIEVDEIERWPDHTGQGVPAIERWSDYMGQGEAAIERLLVHTRGGGGGGGGREELHLPIGCH